jgi:hypothetical protein
MDIEEIKALGIEDEELAGKLAAKFGETVSGLKQNQATLLQEKKSLAAKMAAFDGVDPEEYRKLRERADELENKHLKDGGEFEKLREKMEKQWQEKLGGKDETINSLMNMVKSDRKSAAINEAVRKHEGVAALTRVLAASVQAVDKGGEIVLQVMADDGSPVIGDDGKPMSIDGYVELLKSDVEYAGLFKSSGLSGGGSSHSKGSPAGKTMKREVFDQLSQVERVKFVKDGGKVSD